MRKISIALILLLSASVAWGFPVQLDTTNFDGNLSGLTTLQEFADDYDDFSGGGTSDTMTLNELSSDPADPNEGSSVLWQSDSTGAGDDGDVLMKIQAGSVVKTINFIDFSRGTIDSTDLPECSNTKGILPTTSGVLDGYVPKKQADGSVAWAADTTGSGGSAVIYNLGNDGVTESSDLTQIAVQNDTGSVWSEPSVDKALFDGANLIYESELDAESELETQLSDVTDVFTNNDGALNDDDVTDDNVESMATAGASGYAPLSDGANGLAMTDVWTESENTAAGYISATLTQEEVEDYAGGMFTTNTETRCTVTYQDIDGTIDVVVDDMNDDVPESGDFGNAAALDADGSITDGVIGEADLNCDNLPTDEYLLTYEVDTGNLEWQSAGAGLGSVNTVKEDDAQVGGTDIVTLDFGNGLDVVESPDTEVQITVDASELQLDDLGDVSNTGNSGFMLKDDGDGSYSFTDTISLTHIDLEQVTSGNEPTTDGRIFHRTTDDRIGIGVDGSTYKMALMEGDVLKGRAAITSDADGINLTGSDSGSIILMTGVGEVGLPDCDSDLIGAFVTVWVRDASEQVEVVMYGDTTNDLFRLSDGTELDANDEADLTTAGNEQFCFMCMEANKWYVYSEDATVTDGGAAD